LPLDVRVPLNSLPLLEPLKIASVPLRKGGGLVDGW
jgi:hypothetical protein